MKEKNIDFKQQTIRLPIATHKRFKFYCVEHDISMNIKINALIEECLKKAEQEQEEG